MVLDCRVLLPVSFLLFHFWCWLTKHTVKRVMVWVFHRLIYIVCVCVCVCVCVHVAFEFSGAKMSRFDYVRPKRMTVVLLNTCLNAKITISSWKSRRKTFLKKLLFPLPKLLSVYSLSSENLSSNISTRHMVSTNLPDTRLTLINTAEHKVM